MGMPVGRDVSHQELFDMDGSLGNAMGSQMSRCRERNSMWVSLAVTIAFLFGVQPGELRRLMFAAGTTTS